MTRFITEYKLSHYTGQVEKRLRLWEEKNIAQRIWAMDGTVWIPNQEQAKQTSELTNRLDWLTMPEVMNTKLKELNKFAMEIKQSRYQFVVLLGMGGSSLAPEVFMSIFKNQPGFPILIVQDSTHPDAIQWVTDQINFKKTLFIVSSKSGTTIETLSSMKYFYNRLREQSLSASENFVAITDPGSKLEVMARDLKFRRIFLTPLNIGGRFSALTYFGMIPAAVIGINTKKIIEPALKMAQAIHANQNIDENPGLRLGAAMGELALSGRDKLTLLISPTLAPFGMWLEQLIAESTGKQGRGILPIMDEPLGAMDEYGDDRFFIYLRLNNDHNAELDEFVSNLELINQPTIKIFLKDKYDLGGEFFRWEFATATAGEVLGINPFDQPNVEATKKKTIALIETYKAQGMLPTLQSIWKNNSLEIYDGPCTNKDLNPADILAGFLNERLLDGYLALMAYLPNAVEVSGILNEIRLLLRKNLKLATTLGYGPRFLHSTGQLHKGDSNKGNFIQIANVPKNKIKISDEVYTFNILIEAQAQGDFQALKDMNRHVLRINIIKELIPGLQQMGDIFKEALTKCS